MAWIVFFAFVIAVMAFIRLAPSDPEHWHVKPDEVEPIGFYSNLGQFTGVFSVEGDGTYRLGRLARLAQGTERTLLLAGSVEEGHMTWVTRSVIFGFPDYTTASLHPVEGGKTVLRVFARLRFGVDDLGVNEKRVRDWSTIILAD